MTRSDTIAELTKALVKAQKAVKGAAKSSINPHFKSRYADLSEVMDACVPALNANGLAVLQPVRADGPLVTITTMLVHESGEWIAEDLAMKAVQDTPQGIGSAITYGRRYGLSALVGVAPEDDDGNAASQDNESARQQYAASQTAPPAPPAPNGYVKWIDSLYLVADEGTEAFRKAWTHPGSTPELRAYITKYGRGKLEEMQSKAQQADNKAARVTS